MLFSLFAINLALVLDPFELSPGFRRRPKGPWTTAMVGAKGLSGGNAG